MRDKERAMHGIFGLFVTYLNDCERGPVLVRHQLSLASGTLV
jgi:hypothetical protein